MKAFKIENSMRVMPEDQNTGGFFIALLRKNKHVNFSKGVVNQEVELEKPVVKVKGNNGPKWINPKKTEEVQEVKAFKPFDQRGVKTEYLPFADKHLDEWNCIRDMYGLPDDLKTHLYISLDGNNRVFLVNQGVKEFLEADTKKTIKQVNIGIRAFQRCKNKQNGDRIVFRITQEGVQSLFHCFTKRKISIGLESLLFMVDHPNAKFSEVTEEQKELHAIVTGEESGYFALYVEKDGEIIEMACLMKFGASLMLMASKEHIDGLKIKYHSKFSI